jgi:hypothetical protein
MSSVRDAMRAVLSVAVLVALTAAPSWAQGLPSASPESVGCQRNAWSGSIAS